MNFGDQIGKYQQSEIVILSRVQHYIFWSFSFALFFKTGHFSGSRIFVIFSKKVLKYDVTKTSFPQNIFHGVSEILMEDVNLIPDKVLKTWYRYLPSFLSCRENPRWVRLCLPLKFHYRNDCPGCLIYSMLTPKKFKFWFLSKMNNNKIRHFRF